jgi:tRNA1(Val) A37 N6-methylase TrmN6
MGEGTPLAVWVDAALRRLQPKGYLTMIQRVERLPDLLAACDGSIGGIRVLPLASRQGRPADRVILRARKAARGGFALLSPVVVHNGDRHDGDRASYTPPIAAILREGAGFSVDWG